MLLSGNKGITISPVVTLCCWRQKLNFSHAVLRHLVEAGLEKTSGDIYLKRPPDWLVEAIITGKKSHDGLVAGKRLSRNNHKAIKLQCIFICCHCSCRGHWICSDGLHMPFKCLCLKISCFSIYALFNIYTYNIPLSGFCHVGIL